MTLPSQAGSSFLDLFRSLSIRRTPFVTKPHRRSYSWMTKTRLDAGAVSGSSRMRPFRQICPPTLIRSLGSNLTGPTLSSGWTAFAARSSRTSRRSRLRRRSQSRSAPNHLQPSGAGHRRRDGWTPNRKPSECPARPHSPASFGPPFPRSRGMNIGTRFRYSR